jgi:hypothetical protein
MSEQDAIEVAMSASRLRIGCEIAQRGRLTARGLEWQGYEVELRDQMRMAQFRFTSREEADAFLKVRDEERTLYGR